MGIRESRLPVHDSFILPVYLLQRNVLFCFVLCFSSFFENLIGTSIPDYSSLRLPDHVRPLTYNLKMKVYLPSYPDVPPEKELTFDGEVDILVRVLAPTNMIILHMLNFTIRNAHVLAKGEDILHNYETSGERAEKMEVGVFSLKTTIPADQQIRIK
ncbi:Peptidase M1 domain containing protein, partial [Trichostrongylus colubriformis]